MNQSFNKSTFDPSPCEHDMPGWRAHLVILPPKTLVVKKSADGDFFDIKAANFAIGMKRGNERGCRHDAKCGKRG
jgi:hypothetical protein